MRLFNDDCYSNTPSDFCSSTWLRRTSISASIFCDWACSQAVCASMTVVGVMTPSWNPRLAVRRFSSARSMLVLAMVSFLLASSTRKEFWLTCSSIISRASSSSRLAMAVAPFEARTLYFTSPQFQMGTRSITPTCQKPLNFFSKPFSTLGLLMA